MEKIGGEAMTLRLRAEGSLFKVDVSATVIVCLFMFPNISAAPKTVSTVTVITQFTVKAVTRH